MKIETQTTPLIVEKIRQRVAALEKEQAEAKVIKQTLEDAIFADTDYQELDNKIRDLQLKQKQIKETIYEKKEHKKAKEKLKAVNESLADLTSMLSSELIIYNRDTDKAEVEVLDGSLRRIVIKASIKKTNQMSLGI